MFKKKDLGPVKCALYGDSKEILLNMNKAWLMYLFQAKFNCRHLFEKWIQTTQKRPFRSTNKTSRHETISKIDTIC